MGSDDRDSPSLSPRGGARQNPKMPGEVAEMESEKICPQEYEMQEQPIDRRPQVFRQRDIDEEIENQRQGEHCV